MKMRTLDPRCSFVVLKLDRWRNLEDVAESDVLTDISGSRSVMRGRGCCVPEIGDDAGC